MRLSEVVTVWKQGHLHARVHSSIAHNQPEVEAAPCPLKDDGQKQHGPSTQQVSLSLQQEGRPDTWHSMDKPGGHHVQWHKPVTKAHILCDSTPTSCHIHRDGKNGGRQGNGSCGTMGTVETHQRGLNPQSHDTKTHKCPTPSPVTFGVSLSRESSHHFENWKRKEKFKHIFCLFPVWTIARSNQLGFRKRIS